MNQKNIERDLLQQEYDNTESQLEQLKHPQEPHPPRRAHGCRRQYHRPFGVVSKCALSIITKGIRTLF